jgi:carbonic anhydrase
VVTPAYTGPYAGLAKSEWNYQDHGVSWKIGECHSGIKQSPIALPAEADFVDDSMFYRYQLFYNDLKLYNDGFLLAITLQQCVGGFGIGNKEFAKSTSGPLEVDDKYNLAMIVLHSPSEHTWGGEHLPLEVQLVHRHMQDPKQLGVISIGFQHGGPDVVDHPFLSMLLEEPLPRDPHTFSTVNSRHPSILNLAELIPDNSTFFTYEGSMTVPRCKPNVKWFVRRSYVAAPQSQINPIFEAIKGMTEGAGNNRVQQPLGDRKVHLMEAYDASALKTMREEHAENTAPPTVEVLGGSPDDEDAVKVAPTAQGADATDEGDKKKEEAKNFNPHDPDTIVKAFNRTVIMESPHLVTEAHPAVQQAKEVLDEKQQEYDTAEQQSAYACKDVFYAEELAKKAPESEILQVRAKALRKACDSGDEVVVATKAELDAAKVEYHHHLNINNAGIMDAQKIVKKMQEREAKMTTADINVKTAESVPVGAVTNEYEAPDSESLDPFALECAEMKARITEQHPTMAEHLYPSLDTPADIPGLHKMMADDEEDVPAPSDGGDDDEPVTTPPPAGFLF